MSIRSISTNTEILTEIGSRLKALRIDASLSQSELADRTGISKRTIGNLENGKDISLSTLIEVMRALGIVQRMDMMIPEQELRPSQEYLYGKARQRVGKRIERKSDWKWGDEE
ncbi:MAG: helix-turn-helix transcriptional regulator [Spirochaetales bacterium]|nr:helix-turn-helix transcriptional regulator [Spirochaetales bacterium]MBR5098619.1 helix-turn-helix transcriptional regulator [Spirochaetales bacterium]